MGEIVLHETFNYKLVEKKIGYKFKNKQLLLVAFTHSTYANTFKIKNNQRLEFLGDSVLGLSVANWLFENSDDREGKLSTTKSHIVNEKNLCVVLDQMEVSDFLLVNKGKKDQELKTLPSVKADLFESILGAIFLDSNFKTANKWVLKTLGLNKKQADRVIAERSEQDYKTQLQELLQQQGHSTVEYRVINEEGKPHERIYTIQIVINGVAGLCCSGINKKQVEQNVAKNTIEQLKDIK